MPLFTILIPTYNHCDTLIYAIKSIQSQTIQDFEIFVVGDGAPARTDEIMDQLCSEDKRIMYFPNPKGEGHGEKYRNEAINTANGKYISYLCDDDLWFNCHLKTINDGLEKSDFVFTDHCAVHSDETIKFLPYSLDSISSKWMLQNKTWGFFSPSCVAHTLEAYNKLPHGWRPKPENMRSDQYMWQQWLDQHWVRFNQIDKITYIKITAVGRYNKSPIERAKELDSIWAKMQTPEYLSTLVNEKKRQQRIGWERKSWYFKVGKALEDASNYNLAEEAFYKALSFNVSDAKIWFRLSRTSLKKGHSKQALEQINHALDIIPDNEYFLSHLGSIYSSISDYENAIVCFENALNIKPDAVSIKKKLESIRVKQNNMNK